MGRKSLLIVCILVISALRIIAQDGSAFEFIENKGQWNDKVQFKGELSSGAFFLQKKGFTVLLHNPNDLSLIIGHNSISEKTTAVKKKPKKINGVREDEAVSNGASSSKAHILRSHAYNVEFEGGNENAQVIPDKPLPTYNNYLIGNDPSKWAGNVKIFHAVLYKNIYPNIDVRYYSENGRLKYDLIIYPGGDPGKIALKYTGADKLSVKNNELVIKTSVGEVRELYPYTFQSDNVKGRKEIPCKYIITGNNTVKFQVSEYSKSQPLIIDPSLIFSSFTGSSADQYGFTATPGPDGSFYSGGIVFGSGFPTTPGAFQTNFQGGGGEVGIDVGIMKFSPNGSQRVYATYIGGNENEYPHSLICDPQGNLIVMGRTYSSNFPGTTEGPCVDANIFVTKLNSSGSGIIGSMRIGGSLADGVNIADIQRSEAHEPQSLIRFYGDDSRSEVILDPGNNIYVAAQTRSTDFPVSKATCFQPDLGGGQDGVILKINPDCTGLIWASYLGGTGDDGAFVLDLNPVDGNLYVSGGTTSSDFPGPKAGSISGAFLGGTADGYVAVINSSGTQLIKSTYLGTPNVDVVYGIQFDKLGFPYIMGVSSGDFGVRNAAFSNAGSSQFIAKLKPDLSSYVYSTVFGSGTSKPNMSPVAFLVDRCENVYISGWGGWIEEESEDPYKMAGVGGMPVTSDAIKSITDNHDFYFAVIKRDASSLLYGSFFGQDHGRYSEHVDGGTSRYDEQGVVYQAICANCGGGARFPTTGGVVGPVNGANGGCNLAAVKIAFNFAGVNAGPKSYFNNAPDSIGCVPFTLQLRDTVLNAKSYEWSFGDGTPDATTTQAELNHTFTQIGNFRVRLIAVDSTTCNIRDTAYINVTVRDDKANLAFDIVKLLPCESLNYQFDNLSTAPPGKPFGPSSFTWDFGDGTRFATGSGSQDHSYTAPGTYLVSLVLSDTNYCNSPDSLTKELRVAPLVKAQFETPPAGCVPYTAVFTNTSLAGQTFTWDFGDGTTSNEINPSHDYNAPGPYTITLTVVDSGTCNIRDVTSQSITVANRPTAEFTFAPVTPEVNKPTIFTNQSSGGARYKWLFGDGDSTLKTTADTTLHQYNASGIYNVCLITYNQFGCTDTACHDVRAIINPLLDVPNAFTPGKFGRNSVVRVEGFGIARMSFKIYNRWGQKVFESNDRRIGWDGTFNGQIQPVDVYTYTLDVEFSDATKTRKTGDITLIR